MEIVHSRVAGIDVHKKQITVAVRLPGKRGRHQQVRRYATFYAALREMTAWLTGLGVTHVAMEATGIYWRPVWHALAEAGSLEVLVCNAAHVKNVPGRKSDLLTELRRGRGVVAGRVPTRASTVSPWLEKRTRYGICPA